MLPRAQTSVIPAYKAAFLYFHPHALKYLPCFPMTIAHEDSLRMLNWPEEAGAEKSCTIP